MEDQLDPFTSDLFNTSSEFGVYLSNQSLRKVIAFTTTEPIIALRNELSRLIESAIEPYHVSRKKDSQQHYIFLKSTKEISIPNLVQLPRIKVEIKLQNPELKNLKRTIGSIIDLNVNPDNKEEPMMLHLIVKGSKYGIELHLRMDDRDSTYNRELTLKGFLNERRQSTPVNDIQLHNPLNL